MMARSNDDIPLRTSTFSFDHQLLALVLEDVANPAPVHPAGFNQTLVAWVGRIGSRSTNKDPIQDCHASVGMTKLTVLK